MEQIADFHLHSRFSRACSRDLNIKNLDRAARIKGLQILGTGDFTHPEWFRELEEELVEIKVATTHPVTCGATPLERGISASIPLSRGVADRPGCVGSEGSGLYRYRDALDNNVKFTLTSEVALIYKDDVRVRRIHLVIHGPSLEAVRELNKILDQRFNLKSDGRPILGISAPEFVKLVLSVHPLFLIYPAHIWTPWFSVFGSKSGFDGLEDCFREETPNIFAYETGLSSDPAMNWRVQALDRLTCLSSSDAHSLANIGREATIFDLNDVAYKEIYEAIKNRDVKKLKGTLEYYPEGGMYHIDGHRDCKVGYGSDQWSEHNGICPVCGKKLTIGVTSRVANLATRPSEYYLKGAPGFEKLIELDKIIAESLEIKTRTSVKVVNVYNEMIARLGSEFEILRRASLTDIERISNKKIADGIRRMRAGEVKLKPGYDGQYGEVRVF